FFFSSRRRHTRSKRDWSSDVCSSDLELSKNNWSLNYITNVVTSQVSKGVQEEVKKAMLGINQADRNTQILIELVQGFMQHYEVEGIITTEVHSPIFMKEVERLVKERITKQKQKKDSRVR